MGGLSSDPMINDQRKKFEEMIKKSEINLETPFKQIEDYVNFKENRVNQLNTNDQAKARDILKEITTEGIYGEDKYKINKDGSLSKNPDFVSQDDSYIDIDSNQNPDEEEEDSYIQLDSIQDEENIYDNE